MRFFVRDTMPSSSVTYAQGESPQAFSIARPQLPFATLAAEWLKRARLHGNTVCNDTNSGSAGGFLLMIVCAHFWRNFVPFEASRGKPF